MSAFAVNADMRSCARPGRPNRSLRWRLDYFRVQCERTLLCDIASRKCLWPSAHGYFLLAELGLDIIPVPEP
jgi:hypothetical protein